MKRFVLSVTILLLSVSVSAQDYGQDAVIPLLDNAMATSNSLTGPEQGTPRWLTNTTASALYLFRADPSKATEQAVVICPGGGYAGLAMEHEGVQMGKWFAANGIMAAVLKYRMPNGHREVPLEDVEHALRTMCGLEAGATGFTRNQVGIVGSSAGGHLAATASTVGKHKPAFAILFYPVISTTEGLAHKGSFDNLLGVGRTAEENNSYSLENRVTDATPPTLLLLSDDDNTVPPGNSIRYYTALKAHGVPASIHIFPSGGHGWGMREDFNYREQWQALVLDWLHRLNK